MGKKKTETGGCELCLREEVEITVHHLTPKEMGGTFLPTAKLGIPCNKQTMLYIQMLSSQQG
jgi:hypothetical protein